MLGRMSDRSTFTPQPPAWLRAATDGQQARQRGEPRDFGPYAERYPGSSGLVPPEQAWLAAWDREDDRLAAEQSQPSLPGEDLWSPVRRQSVP